MTFCSWARSKETPVSVQVGSFGRWSASRRDSVGSFSKAAIARRTVQSHISRQISDLERECGARLFRRTGRGVVLTDLGERTSALASAIPASGSRRTRVSEESGSYGEGQLTDFVANSHNRP
jgi:Bacterial regulatory helix-turn-helix protein, lysR family